MDRLITQGFDTAKERMSDSEDNSEEIIQNAAQKDKDVKNVKEKYDFYAQIYYQSVMRTLSNFRL